MKKLINLLVGLGLIAVAVYVILFIPTVIDFSAVRVRLEDNDTIYQFLIYLPIIISIFNAIVALVNIFSKNIVLTIMNIVISLGVVIYLVMDVMGSVFAIKEIGAKLLYIEYVNIACIVLLVIEVITHFISEKRKSLKEA